MHFCNLPIEPLNAVIYTKRKILMDKPCLSYFLHIMVPKYVSLLNRHFKYPRYLNKLTRSKKPGIKFSQHLKNLNFKFTGDPRNVPHNRSVPYTQNGNIAENICANEVAKNTTFLPAVGISEERKLR